MAEELDAQQADPFARQVGGDHYAKMKIQPVVFIEQNGIPFLEGSAIKYLCRWREKGGIADLEKAKHFIDLRIAMEREKAKGQEPKKASPSGGLVCNDPDCWCRSWFRDEKASQPADATCQRGGAT